MSFFVEFDYDMSFVSGGVVTDTIRDVLERAVGGSNVFHYVDRGHYKFRTDKYTSHIDVYVFDDIGSTQIFVDRGGFVPPRDVLRILYGLESAFETTGVMKIRFMRGYNKDESLVDLSPMVVSEVFKIDEENYLEHWIPEVEDMMEGG